MTWQQQPRKVLLLAKQLMYATHRPDNVEEFAGAMAAGHGTLSAAMMAGAWRKKSNRNQTAFRERIDGIDHLTTLVWLGFIFSVEFN